MPRPPLPRLGALALACLVLPATAPQAQKFPGNVPAQAWPGYGPGYPPVQEGGQPYPYAQPGSSKFGPAPVRPRPAPPAATAPVQADLGPDALQVAPEDPPTVVGRVARVAGTASLRLTGAEEWRPATPNTAIVAGNAIWTEPGARAAVEAGTATLFLDGGTALQVDALDEQGLRATLAQGSLLLRTSGLEAAGDTIDIATPEASIATAIDARILVETASSDGSRPGRVAVYEGAAEVTLASSSTPLRLGPGEAITLAPGVADPAIEPAGPPTPLLAWALGAEPRAPLPAAVRGMTGARELGLHGRWERSPDYGDIWYPPVAPDWVPYSDGSWEWREPWGWTWVDAAPWGFAPSHYGRWVRTGPRWGWAPAPVPVVGLPPLRPVWAPALVVFFGGPGVVRGPAPPLGWVPLGPREAWYPWYRCSPAYVTRLNLRQVPYLRPVQERWVAHGGPALRWGGPSVAGGASPWAAERRLDAFRNRAAATVVPDRALLASLPVREAGRRARWEELRGGAPAAGLPLAPGPGTRGLTERGAARFGLAPDAVRAGAGRERAAAPPPTLRAALPEATPRAAGRDGSPRPEAAELRQRLQEDRLRRQQQPEAPRSPVADSILRDQRQQELRQRLLDDPARRRQGEPGIPPGAPRLSQERMQRQEEGEARRQQEQAQRQQMEQARRQQQEMQRQQEGEGRRQQEQAQRQQMEQARRQQQEMQRQQENEGRRQQEQAQRQQMEQARRQQQEMQRQQENEGRRQQEQAQRQQAEQARRQQQEMQRQQEGDARRQQEQAQRQQAEQARRQQQEMQRQQEGDARRQQEQAQRQQAEQARRQQQEMQRQQENEGRRQQEQAQRQQMEQARRQQQEIQRQQEGEARRQQEQMQRQQMEQARRQQEQAQRQQMEQARRQQEQAQRQQMEQARRQQEQAQRQQMDQAQRQQAEQARRQQAQQQRRDERQR